MSTFIDVSDVCEAGRAQIILIDMVGSPRAVSLAVVRASISAVLTICAVGVCQNSPQGMLLYNSDEASALAVIFTWALFKVHFIVTLIGGGGLIVSLPVTANTFNACIPVWYYS